MKKIIVFLIFFFIVFFISGEKLATFDNIYKPRSFRVEGDDLYVVDESVIKLFSMKDFKFIAQIGKNGEGPGEFKYSPQIMIFPNLVFAFSSGKVSFFTRKGKLIKEKKTPNLPRVYKVQKNYLVEEMDFNRRKRIVKLNVKVLDNNFILIKNILTYTPPNLTIVVSGMKTKKENRLVIPDYTWTTTDGNMIYTADTKKGFFIEIYDHNGKKVNTINNNYKKLKVSDEYKKKEMDKLKRSKNWERNIKRFNYIFPEYFPAYKKFAVNKGNIYVFTYRTKEKEREIIILDLQGKILKKTFVPEEKYYNISSNKFYYFVDNEDDEVMEFHSIDL